jgi:transposase InsO family protein
MEPDRWAYENGITPDVPRFGMPTDNALVEAFNDGLRDGCLNATVSSSLAETRSRIETGRRRVQPVPSSHSPGEWLTPQVFALALLQLAAEWDPELTSRPDRGWGILDRGRVRTAPTWLRPASEPGR